MELNPTHLDRTTAPERLGPDAACILQNVDVEWLTGRPRRGPGYARSQQGPSTTTVTSAFVWTTAQCKKLIVDGNLNGDVRVTPADGSVQCSGPLPEWMDSDVFASTPTDLYSENFNEDAGVDLVAGSSSSI